MNDNYLWCGNKCISIDVSFRQLPGTSGEDPFRLLANCILSFCKDRVPALWTQLHKNDDKQNTEGFSDN